MHFINNAMQNVGEHLNSFSEQQKSRMADTLASMTSLNRQNILTCEAMFNNFSDAFRVEPGLTLLQQKYVGGKPCPTLYHSMALVSVAPPTATRRDYSKKCPPAGRVPASIENILTILLVQGKKMDDIFMQNGYHV